jgi:hypothetical protein
MGINLWSGTGAFVLIPGVDGEHIVRFWAWSRVIAQGKARHLSMMFGVLRFTKKLKAES